MENKTETKTETPKVATPLNEASRLLGVTPSRQLLVNNENVIQYEFHCEDCNVTSQKNSEPFKVHNNKKREKQNRIEKKRYAEQERERQEKHQKEELERNINKEIYMSYKKDYRLWKKRQKENRSFLEKVFGMEPPLKYRNYDEFMYGEHEEIWEKNLDASDSLSLSMANWVWTVGPDIKPTRFIKCPVCGHKHYF